MPTLNIGGKTVTVDDSFLKMPPDQQNAQVQEIAKSMGLGAAPATASPQGTPPAGAEQAPAYQPSAVPWIDGVNAFANSAVDAIPIVGPALTNAGHTVDAAFNNALAPVFGFQQETPQDRANIDTAEQQQFPIASGAGAVAGTVAPFVIGGGILPAAGKMALGMEGPLLLRAGAGAASSGAIGGADALARGDSTGEAQGQAAADAVIGGALPFVGAAVSKVLAGAPKVPSLDGLQAIKNAMYARADNLGVRYSPQGYRDLAADMVVDANADHLSPTRHPLATSMLTDVVQKPPTYSPTLTQVDQLRQVVRRDVASNADDAEAHFGQGMINNIDNFIDNASGPQLVSGSGSDAAEAITGARQANSVYKKSETVSNALAKADLQAAATGSGGNIANKTRQAFASILNDPKKVAGFTQEERDAMESVVRGGPLTNAARLVGKLSPTGNGLMTALGIGGAAAKPALAFVPVVGTVAKLMSDHNTLGRAKLVQALIANGGKTLPPASPIASAMLNRIGGPAGATLLENRLSGGPDPIAHAMLAAASQ